MKHLCSGSFIVSLARTRHPICSPSSHWTFIAAEQCLDQWRDENMKTSVKRKMCFCHRDSGESLLVPETFCSCAFQPPPIFSPKTLTSQNTSLAAKIPRSFVSSAVSAHLYVKWIPRAAAQHSFPSRSVRARATWCSSSSSPGCSCITFARRTRGQRAGWATEAAAFLRWAFCLSACSVSVCQMQRRIHPEEE